LISTHEKKGKRKEVELPGKKKGLLFEGKEKYFYIHWQIEERGGREDCREGKVILCLLWSEKEKEGNWGRKKGEELSYFNLKRGGGKRQSFDFEEGEKRGDRSGDRRGT